MRADLKLIPCFRLCLEGLGLSELGLVPLVCAHAPSKLPTQTNRCYLKPNGAQVLDLSMEEHNDFLKEMGKSHPRDIAAQGAFSSCATKVQTSSKDLSHEERRWRLQKCRCFLRAPFLRFVQAK